MLILHVRSYLVVFVSFIMTSCLNTDIETKLKSMRENSVSFPPSLLQIMPGDSLIQTPITSSRPLLVVYLDSTECIPCRINRFDQYEELRKETSGKVEVAVIMSPKRDDCNLSSHYVSIQHFGVKVYLDTTQRFHHLNSFIPDDTRFHSFLIDSDNTPVVIGDPIYSLKIKNLLFNYLSHNTL